MTIKRKSTAKVRGEVVHFTKEGLVRFEGGSPRGVAADGVWLDLIQAYGGTVKALAKALGVSETQVYRWAVEGKPMSSGNEFRVRFIAAAVGLPMPPFTPATRKRATRKRATRKSGGKKSGGKKSGGKKRGGK
jgi:hypothetical protein